MWKIFSNISIFLLLCMTVQSKLLIKPPNLEYEVYIEGDPDDDKLILTPYIEDDDIETARNLSAVIGEPFPDDVPSYSGYLTVNKEYNSNLFFWFFPAEVNYEESPVILWLQGGPGSPSVYSVILELGPFILDSVDYFHLKKNPYSWHKFSSVLFIDNPVGTGFSYTEDDAGYATNQTQIGNELYSALIQFFTLFPELQENDFYVAGESYGGKYAPATGYTIYKNNPTADLKINLKGLLISSGFTDPISMMYYSDHVYDLGLVDEHIRDQMRVTEMAARQNITEGNMTGAFLSFGSTMLLYQVNSKMNAYNVLNFHYEEDDVGYVYFFANSTITEALHTGNIQFGKNATIVYENLIEDFMLSQKEKVEEMLDNGFRILYYNGQFDVITGYTLMKHYYSSLSFNSAEEYKTANRTTWFVDNDIAGYYKSAGNLTEAMIRNAGHLIAGDQGLWVQTLIKEFVTNNL